MIAARCDVCNKKRPTAHWPGKNGGMRLCADCYDRAGAPPEKQPVNGHASNGNGRHMLLTRAGAIKSERIRWLSHGRIPLRGLTFCAGQKGLGKSIWTNAHIVASLTRGILPGELEGQAADVLVVTAEDDWRSVVKPRLQAYGADLDRVYRVEVHDEHGPTVLTLPDDVQALRERITDLRREGRTVPLLVIDPIGAFVPSNANTHADAPVRRILAPLAQLADEMNIAVLIVAHLNKDETAKLINRISGAGAFVNAARSVLVFVRDPEDPDGDQGMRRLILHAASNWSVYAPTLAAHVEGRDIDTDDGEVTSVGYLVMDGESPLTVDDVQGGSARQHEFADDAEEAILAALEGGPRQSREVKTVVMAELDCSRQTVERASTRLHERGEIDITAGGFPRRTTWTLRPLEPQSPHAPALQLPHSLCPPDEVTGRNGSTEPNANPREATVSPVTSRPGHRGHWTLDDELDDLLRAAKVPRMSETQTPEPETTEPERPADEPHPEADPTAPGVEPDDEDGEAE
jgi:hypothetical protein